MVKYDKMWERMKKMGLFQSDLLNVVSAPTVSMLKKNKYVKLNTIENICIFLQNLEKYLRRPEERAGGRDGEQIKFSNLNHKMNTLRW